jgi:uncharacterized PurR-regulated membrane protein YhhQ (DUF165 family)
MENFAVTGLLVAALILPIALFLLLRLRFRLAGLVAAATAVAAGWVLNVAWAFVAQGTATQDPSQGNTLSIAADFGWASPTVLVLAPWLVWHLVTRRAALRR